MLQNLLDKRILNGESYIFKLYVPKNENTGYS